MIKVKNLTKIYRTHIRQNNILKDIFFRQYKMNTAVDNLSFEINENELVGFIGPNGSGKTTTLKMLSGILYPTKGEIKIMGFVPFEKKHSFLKQISFIMGNRNQLYWDLPAVDSFKLYKEIYEISDTQFKKTIDDLTSLLNCKKLIDKRVKTLSFGERMKMEFIAALIHRPKIIFLDEPTIGLDIFSQELVREFIKNYQKEFKATIVLTSHYLEDVKKLAKKLIIINQGKIIYSGDLKSIIEKYSKNKIITIILEKSASKELIQKLGKIISYRFPQIIIQVDKNSLPQTVFLINKYLSFSDLTIKEEGIEKVVKELFKPLSQINFQD